MFTRRWSPLAVGCIVAACCLSVAGVALPQQRPVATIEYAEFFTGELKRLEPHLDFEAVRFDLENRGKPLPLVLTLEDWKDGKVTVLKTMQGVLQNKGEIGLSWREIKEENEISSFRLVLAVHRGGHLPNGIAHSGFQSTPLLWQPGKSRLMSCTSLGEVTELDKNRPVYAWMIGTHKGQARIAVGDPVEKAAKMAAHALVLKIRVVE